MSNFSLNGASSEGHSILPSGTDSTKQRTQEREIDKTISSEGTEIFKALSQEVPITESQHTFKCKDLLKVPGAIFTAFKKVFLHYSLLKSPETMPLNRLESFASLENTNPVIAYALCKKYLENNESDVNKVNEKLYRKGSSG